MKKVSLLILVLVVLVVGVVFVWMGLRGKKSGESGVSGKECVVTGCNGELCEEKRQDQSASICILLPEAECYKTAECKQQESGQCGWTQTEELKACIEKSKL